MTTPAHLTNRLETIAIRQGKTRLRDALFAACVVLAAAVSVFTVSAASHGARASTSQVAQR